MRATQPYLSDPFSTKPIIVTRQRIMDLIPSCQEPVDPFSPQQFGNHCTAAHLSYANRTHGNRGRHVNTLARLLGNRRRSVVVVFLVFVVAGCRAGVADNLNHYLRDSWAQSCDQSLMAAAEGDSFKLLRCWVCDAERDLGVDWLEDAFGDVGRSSGTEDARLRELIAFALVGIGQACSLGKPEEFRDGHPCKNPAVLFELASKTLVPISCEATTHKLSTPKNGHPSLAFVANGSLTLDELCGGLKAATREDIAPLFWLAASDLGADETGGSPHLDRTYVNAILVKVLLLLQESGPKWTDDERFFLSTALTLKGLLAIRSGEHPDFDPCDETRRPSSGNDAGRIEGLRWLRYAFDITHRRLLLVPALAIRGLRNQDWDNPYMHTVGQGIEAMVAHARGINPCTAWPAYAALNIASMDYILGAWDSEARMPVE